MIEVRLEAQGDGSVDVLNDLYDWLRQEQELRGLIRLIPAPILPGMLGAETGVLAIPVDAGWLPPAARRPPF